MGLSRATTFRAWCNGREIDSTDLRWSESFTEAESVVAPCTLHKACVIIARDCKNGTTIRLYTVKQSTRNGTYRPAYDGRGKVFVGNLELTQVGEMEMEAFEPRRPFDALRDNAVNAAQPHDPVEIEG